MRRHAAAVERDLRGVGSALPGLVLDPGDDEPGRGRVDDERADALLAGRAVGDREHDRDVGVAARGDELLDAREHVVAVARLGAGRDRAGVRADLRFGEAEAAELPARGERTQVLRLLLVGAEGENRAAHHRVLHGDDRRRRAVARGDLLEREGERDVVGAGAAPGLRDHHAEGAELAQRGQLLAREVMLAIPARRVGREPLAREGAHRVADQSLLFGEQHRIIPRAAARSACRPRRAPVPRRRPSRRRCARRAAVRRAPRRTPAPG